MTAFLMNTDGTFSGIKRIACGAWHSAALATNGDVYVWGWNKHHQMGTAVANICPAPHLLEEPESLGSVVEVISTIATSS